jgi:hypothetical protein
MKELSTETPEVIGERRDCSHHRVPVGQERIAEPQGFSSSIAAGRFDRGCDGFKLALIRERVATQRADVIESAFLDVQIEVAGFSPTHPASL